MGVALYALSIALVVLAAVAIIAVVMRLTGDGGRIRREEVLDAQRRALTAERFIDRLKELAWDHRDVDPALATILIDEIRQFERKNRELPPE